MRGTLEIPKRKDGRKAMMGKRREKGVFIAERSIDLFAKSFSNVSTDKMDILVPSLLCCASITRERSLPRDFFSSCPRAVCVNDSSRSLGKTERDVRDGNRETWMKFRDNFLLLGKFLTRLEYSVEHRLL